MPERESPRSVRFGFEKLGPSNRDSGTTKDELLKNAFYEDEANRMVKRPGIAIDTSFSGACGSGLYSFEDAIIAVVDDDVKVVGTASSFLDYELRSTGQFDRRHRGRAISFNNSLWATGGIGNGAAPYTTFVVKSTDGGTTWTSVSSSPSYGDRADFGFLSHDGKMWVIGGRMNSGGAPETWNNDVFYSKDGATWFTARVDGASSGFTKVSRHAVLSYDDRMWVIGGGISGGKSNEVWYSYNGVAWTQATAAAAWSARDNLAVAIHDNKMWVIGGQDNSSTYKNDVWWSTDGETWTQATAAASFSARINGAAFSKNGYLYCGFGYDATGGAATEQDLWKSLDGATWTQVHADNPDIPSDASPTGVLHSDGALYLFDIMDEDSRHPTGTRVWRSLLDLTSESLGAITTEPAGTVDNPGAICEQVDFAEIQLEPNNIAVLKTKRDAWQLEDGVLTQITDTDYPSETVPGVVSLDGYIFVMTAKAEIHNSDLETPTAWNALNFITAEMEPDSGVALAKHLNYVVALGNWSTEFFYDAANATGSPLSRLESSALWIGCAAARSVVNIGNNLVWVAKDRTKGRFVMALEGLTAQRVSTPAIDRILTASTLTTVRAYPVMLDGHLFYVLNLADDNLTLVMDLMTRRWAVWTTLTAGAAKGITSITRTGETATATSAAHGYSEGAIVTIAGADQSDYNGNFVAHNVATNTFDITVRNAPTTPATGTITVTGYTEGEFIGAYYANNGNANYLQDPATGDIYTISSTVYKDGDAPINVRIRTRDHDMDTLAGKFVSSLRLHADREESFVSLRWSDDDFQTYSKFRDKWLDVDPVHFDRLGKFRRRAFEVAHVGNTAFRLAYLEATPEAGEH